MVFLGPYNPEYIEVEAMLKNLSAIHGEVVFTSSMVPVGDDILPAGTTILSFIVRVNDAFDGDASLVIGDAVDQDRFSDGSLVDLSLQGIYEITVASTLTETAQVRAYLSSSGATQGSAEIWAVVREN